MHCWCVFGIGPHISDHGSLLRVAAYEACLSTYQCALISPWLKAVFTRHYSEWFNWSLLLLSVYSLKLDQTAECSYNAATCVKASLTVTLMDPLLLSAWHRALTYTHKTRKAPESPAPGICRSRLSVKIVCFHVQVFRSQQPPRAEVLNNAGVRYHRTHAQIVSDLTVEIKSVACWKLACAQMTDIRLFYMTNTAVRHYLIRWCTVIVSYSLCIKTYK